MDIGHPFRDALEAFDGVAEHGERPASVTAQQILGWAAERDNWLRDGTGVQASDPVRRTGIKRRSLLYELPYWEVKFSVSHFNFLFVVAGTDPGPIYLLQPCYAGIGGNGGGLGMAGMHSSALGSWHAVFVGLI